MLNPTPSVLFRFDELSGLPRLTSSADILVEVTYRLGNARSAAQKLPHKDLLYFIDMAIFQACEILSMSKIRPTAMDNEGNCHFTRLR